MTSSDGIRYLSTEDQLLSQIVRGFAQLDPVSGNRGNGIKTFVLIIYPCKFNGQPDSDPIFSKKRVTETLTYGYLEMLGTLSKHKEGIEYVSFLIATL